MRCIANLQYFEKYCHNLSLYYLMESGVTAMLKIVDMFIIMSESNLARLFIDLSAFTLQNIPLKLMFYLDI